MSKPKKEQPQFAICIKKMDEDWLMPRKVYEVLPDPEAAKSGYIRVIDDEGEDYLYPADGFVFVSFPSQVRDALRRAS